MSNCDFNDLSSIAIILSVMSFQGEHNKYPRLGRVVTDGHKIKGTLSTQTAQPVTEIILLSELLDAPKTGFEPVCNRGAVLGQEL